VKIKYDYSEDLMSVDGDSFPLKPYRKWLISNHEELVSNHFIRSINTINGTKHTFDWAHIYFIAGEYGFISDYLKQNYELHTRVN
jgi:hypothetical protein